MNPKIWLITDTHFFHNLLIDKNKRPHNYMEKIISNWKNIVKENDIVFHLGDVIFYNYSSLKDLLNNLPGTKILIKGNHDHKTNLWYCKNGFSFCSEMFVYNNILFTHEPSKLNKGNYLCNIHGHVHEISRYNYLTEFLTNKNEILYHRLLSLEKENYCPVDMLKFIKKSKKIKYYINEEK